MIYTLVLNGSNEGKLYDTDLVALFEKARHPLETLIRTGKTFTASLHVEHDTGQHSSGVWEGTTKSPQELFYLLSERLSIATQLGIDVYTEEAKQITLLQAEALRLQLNTLLHNALQVTQALPLWVRVKYAWRVILGRG